MDAFRSFSSRLDIPDIKFIPISALRGNNVSIGPSTWYWYDGPTLLHHLEHVQLTATCRIAVPR